MRALLKPIEVRAALARVDIVGKGEDGLGVAVIVLQTDLDPGVVALAVEVDRLLVDQLLVLVQVLDEGLHPAVEMEDVALLRKGALVGHGDPGCPW